MFCSKLIFVRTDWTACPHIWKDPVILMMLLNPDKPKASRGTSEWTLSNTFIHLLAMIPSLIISPWSYTCSHYFTECWGSGFLRKTSLGSRAKTGKLSPLYQTVLKSTNRLLWPNVIKPQPGSGTVNVPALPILCEQHIHTAAAQHPPLQKKSFITIKPALGESFGTTP